METGIRVSDGTARPPGDARARIAELEARLTEAEETLAAIRNGEVDALVVSGPDGDQIFALEGADHTYRVLVEEMQEGTVTLDPEGLILYCNRQFAVMMGAPVETIVGSRMSRFLSPDQQSRFSLLLPNANNAKKQGELSLRTAHGAPVPVHLSLNRLQTGGLQTVCIVVSDLTEQRQYEAMVKDGELSRLILDQAAEAIIVIDARGKILRASNFAQQLAGRSVDQESFETAFPLWGPERLDTAQLLATAVAKNGLRSVEVKLIHSHKPFSALLLSAAPLWSDTKELLGCVITLTDITARKASEDALARQAQALERSNQDLTQFAYAASHDLREPIRILSIYSQLLERKYNGLLDEQASHFIHVTVQAAHRLEALLDDLLVYTRTADSPDPVESLTDGNVAFAKTMTMLAPTLAECSGSVETDPLPMLRVDEVHLRQLLQNMISNSIKYRSETPLRVQVSARREKQMWVLSVTDNGIGIAPEYHAQVFGLFKRLHGGDKYSGSGIGLAICLKIVERYGGRLWVESEVGKGATFSFTLPAEMSLYDNNQY